MANRFTVDSIFRAVDNFTAPMKRMQDRTDKFIEATEKGLARVDKFNDRISGGIKRAGAIAAGAAFATGAIVKDIVDTGKEFDRTLVAAAAKFDPEIKRGTDGFERLRLAAEDIGEKTEFNAQQGAEALKALAASGFKANQAIAVLPNVVDLATASEIELGAASEMATKALGAFNLKSEDSATLTKNLSRVTDVMAMAAGKTEASMEGLFESIKEGAPLATTAGASMETFIAMASTMAGAGIEASKAGTTLKDVFLALASPTSKATKQLKKFGVTTVDKDGNLRDVVDVMGDLEGKLAGLGTGERAKALEKIFGRIPIAGVAAMLDKGTDSIRKLRDELEHSEGATKKLADTMRDTVAGDIDGFTSAVDGVKIALFSANEGPIRDVIQSMTKWVAANKELIVQNVGDAVKWIGDNLPQIVTWVGRIAKGVAAFYAFSTAVKTMTLAIEGYKAAAELATAANWLFKKSVVGVDTVAAGIGKASEALGAYNVEAAAAKKGMEGIRAGLNASALGESINGVTSKLGQAGLLGAALAVGLAIGYWLNDVLELDRRINDLIDDMAAIGKVASPKQTKRDEKGEIIEYGRPTASLEMAEGRKSFLANEEKMNAIFATPESRRKHHFTLKQQRDYEAMQDKYHAGEQGYKPHVVSPADRTAKSIEESKTTEHAELLIKDQTGRAELKKSKKGPRGTKINLQASGPL